MQTAAENKLQVLVIELIENCYTSSFKQPAVGSWPVKTRSARDPGSLPPSTTTASTDTATPMRGAGATGRAAAADEARAALLNEDASETAKPATPTPLPWFKVLLVGATLFANQFSSLVIFPFLPFLVSVLVRFIVLFSRLQSLHTSCASRLITQTNTPPHRTAAFAFAIFFSVLLYQYWRRAVFAPRSAAADALRRTLCELEIFPPKFECWRPIASHRLMP